MITTILTDEAIEQGREATFSTNNPFCPCDSKTMRKAARWAEQAVLQSPEIQALRKDAERYRWLRSDDSADIVDCLDFSGVVDGQELDAAIDAAMEKQP